MSETAEKIAAEWAKLRLAHEAVMLEDAQQVLKQQRAATAQSSANALDAPALAADEDEGESVIHIGDTFHHQPQPQPPAPPPTPAAPSGLSTLAKVGIAGALLATGVGAGAAIPLAISALTDQPAAQQFTDTNTNYRLVIPAK